MKSQAERFHKSLGLRDRFNGVIPGGSHTYAKGDDQFPENAAPYIVRGKGCHVWDVDGNEFIEYGMGLRSVSLGHGFEPVVKAAMAQMALGSNFVRPAVIELECAEKLRSIIPGAEMVKFAKNGSDVTTAAVRLARAYTGRNMVAICEDHPFYSTDDWFIGTTAMSAGIPDAISSLTLKFHYNDIGSLAALFEKYPKDIACVMLEPERDRFPEDRFLHKVRDLCHRNGALFVLDEMITGFRLHLQGGQGFHHIQADLSAFGKAMANGFSLSALVGRQEIMRLGGYDHDCERVFLLSTTHGAETHSLAASLATMEFYESHPVVQTLWQQGERLKQGVEQVIETRKLQKYVRMIGRPCNLVFGTRDRDGNPSQGFRTLFMQELLRRNILAPSFVVSYSHTNDDVDRTIEATAAALDVYGRALEDGVERYLEGRPVKPVSRKFN